jgi:hypothetical protein
MLRVMGGSRRLNLAMVGGSSTLPPSPTNNHTGSVTPSSSDSAQSATFGSLWQFAVMFTAVFAAMCSYLGSNS